MGKLVLSLPVVSSTPGPAQWRRLACWHGVTRAEGSLRRHAAGVRRGERAASELEPAIEASLAKVSFHSHSSLRDGVCRISPLCCLSENCGRVIVVVFVPIYK